MLIGGEDACGKQWVTILFSGCSACVFAAPRVVPSANERMMPANLFIWYSKSTTFQDRAKVAFVFRCSSVRDVASGELLLKKRQGAVDDEPGQSCREFAVQRGGVQVATCIRLGRCPILMYAHRIFCDHLPF